VDDLVSRSHHGAPIATANAENWREDFVMAIVTGEFKLGQLPSGLVDGRMTGGQR
jgi:hypothetical protein